MEFTFFRADNKIYFPETKQYISNGRYFKVENGSVLVMLPNGSEVDFGNNLKRISSLLDSGDVVGVSEEEYDSNVSSDSPFKPNTEIRSTYTKLGSEAVGTVSNDNRFKVVDPQRAFERGMPVRTEQYLSSALERPETTELVNEKFQEVSVPQEKQIKLATVGEELQNSSPEGSITKSMPLVPMDIPVKSSDANKDYLKSWDKFKSFTKKSERLTFIKQFTYKGVMEFFKDKLESCVESGDVITGEHNHINLEKQYKEFIALLDKQISKSRAQLKV